MVYNGLVSVTNNGLSQTTTRTTDALGQLAEVRDHKNGTTNYAYDPFGNLLATKDAADNVVTMSYDIRGRKVSMDDPDMGSWSYAYNALGELVSQTDARQQTVTLQYDKLGRMIQRSESEGITTWTYDTSPTKGMGKLHQVSGPNGYLQVHTYDSLGRPSQTDTTITMETFTVSTTYDAQGRPDSFTYPATPAHPSGLTVRRHYTATGYLEKITNTAETVTYWRANAMDADGHVTQETLGNGVVTSRAYDPQTGLIQAILSDDMGTPVQDLAYAFDQLGNLTSREDALQQRRESFGYDGLNRVTDATLVDTVSQAQLGAKSFTYDAIGNLTYKSDVGTYLYGQNGAGPHAVTSAGGNTYAYDSNGNMVSGAGRTIGWSSFNKPVSVANGSATLGFLYGPDRSRLQQVKTQGSVTTTIKYVGTRYEKITETGEADEHVHYLAAGGRVAVIKTYSDATPQKTRYLHKDHLGSIDTITDESGNIVERLAYDPWGKRRNPDWSDAAVTIVGQETPRGFTDHEHLDDVGLVHMNGRVYDPVLGRFLSADPFIQFPESTQGFNRYTYANNNPLSFTDPSGFFFKSLFKKLFRAVGKVVKGTVKAVVKVQKEIHTSPIGQAIGTIGAAISCGPLGPVCAAAASATFTAINGGSVGDIIKAAAITYVTASAFRTLHGLPNDTIGEKFVRVVAHGSVGGLSSKAQGGSFRSGIISAGFTQAVSISGAFDGLGDPSPLGGRTANAIAAAVVGGVGAELGGGKFANGAVTGAFSRLFNDLKFVRRGVFRDSETGRIYDYRSQIKYQSPDGYLAEQTGAGSVKDFATFSRGDGANLVQMGNPPALLGRQ